jgi:hypothetical protein
MSAVIEYLGKRDLTGLETELTERGYQVDLYGKELAAVSSIVATKSMHPAVLQDVIKELKDLKYGIARFVYSLPEQAKADLSRFLESPPKSRKKIKGYLVSDF